MAYRAGVRLSSAEVSAAWRNLDVTVGEAAARLGVHATTLRRRARLIQGMPARKGGTSLQYPGARMLWEAGCGAQDMADYYGVTKHAILRHLTKIGAREKAQGRRFTPTTTVSEVLQKRLAEQMARAAAVEQAHMINAEMVDRIGSLTVGARYARRVV